MIKSIFDNGGIDPSVLPNIVPYEKESKEVSFNELYDMYTDDELVISPDYQTLFKWKEKKQNLYNHCFL